MEGAGGSAVPVQPHTNLRGLPARSVKQPRRQSVTMESGDHVHQNLIPSDLVFPKTKAAMTLKLDFKNLFNIPLRKLRLKFFFKK